MKRTILLLCLLAGVCAAVVGDTLGAASNYPTPLVFRSTSSSVSGSWKLGSGTGSADSTTSNVSINNATDDGWYVFAPGSSQSTTRSATIPTSPGTTGWIVDPVGGAAGFPSGTWTFTVHTVVPTGTLDAGTAVLTVGMWKGTLSGGVFTPTATIIDPTDDPAAQDLRADFDLTTSVDFALGKFKLDAGETLFVELWRHQVDGISDAVDANRELELVVNDGGTALTHPAADDTAPTHDIDVDEGTGSTQWDSGTSTLYYKGDDDGSFTVTDSIVDVGSGALEVTYPDVATTGWTHDAETTSDDPQFESSTYEWTAGATTSPGDQSIVAEDNALQTSTGTITFTNDTDGPTGMSAELTGGPGYSTESVPVTVDQGTDAGAGLDTSSGELERASATLADGSCGSYGSYSTVTLDSGNDTSVDTGNCYRYRYRIFDVLTNESVSSDSEDALVDTSAPTVTDTAPTEISGAGDQYWDSTTDTLWFRPAATGSFTLNASASDSQSGIAQVDFPTLVGTTGWSGAGGSDTSSPYASPVSYSWTASASAPGAKTVTATNKTGLTATDTITISADSTAPTGPTAALSGGPWYSTTSVPLTIGTGTDSAAGIDSARTVAERASAPLANGTCGTFGAFAAVTLSGGADTTVASANCYRYQVKATDNVGNVSAASTVTADAKVDATPPTTPTLVFTGLANAAVSGSTIYYRPDGGGSFTVTVASTDPDSGITSYNFPTVSGFTVTGSGASRTFSYTSAPSAPLAPLSVTATNGAGAASATAAFSLVPDPTPPTMTVRCNGKPCLSRSYPKSVLVTMSATDGIGSGIDTIRYSTDGSDPTTDTGNEYTRGFTVARLTTLKARAYDKAGNPSALQTITIRSLADRLAFGAPPKVTVKAKARYVQARVTSSHPAHVTAVMSGPDLKKPVRWRFVLGDGASIVQLRLPAGIKDTGRYSLSWIAQAGSQKAKKKTQVLVKRP
ncbi:MAG TPA: chitobiase/beta-hexosaminidase C-terminal domain-containing protein [Gaiellaceae bacterium]|nr:chitobiase/beta-hexosaminidase C-terminal domain-containing protein [Gaiellaceae bacterium]